MCQGSHPQPDHYFCYLNLFAVKSQTINDATLQNCQKNWNWHIGFSRLVKYLNKAMCCAEQINKELY